MQESNTSIKENVRSKSLDYLAATAKPRRFIWRFRALAIALILASQSFLLVAPSESSAPPTPIDQLPLVQPENLTYVGGFRVPGNEFGSYSPSIPPYDQFNWTSGVVAFNPADGGMFLGCHAYTNGAIAEITVPALVKSTNLADLHTATIIQKASASLIDELKYNLGCGVNSAGGIIVVNGGLIGTAYNGYNAADCTVASHFYTPNTNLASLQVVGLCILDNPFNNEPGAVAGWMCPIPEAWQEALGGYPYITGLGTTSIISQTSAGPAAFGFNPSQLSVGKASASVPYVFYPESHQTLGGWAQSSPASYNGTCFVGGVAFPPNTRSILFFGSAGTGDFCYGGPSGDPGVACGGTNANGSINCCDPCGGGKGPHSFHGGYIYRVWAYDALDFVASANGKKQPWEVLPYGIWTISLPFAPCSHPVGGVTYDPTSGNIYVVQEGADTIQSYSYLPVIQSFKITGLGSASSNSPTAQKSSEKAAQEAAKQRAAALKAAEHAAKDKSKQKEAESKAAKAAAKQKAKQEAAAAKAAEEAAKEKEQHK